MEEDALGCYKVEGPRNKPEMMLSALAPEPDKINQKMISMATRNLFLKEGLKECFGKKLYDR